jgi:endo-1,4-beta-xylanase
LGSERTVIIGAAVDAERLRDEPAYAEAIRTHFNSVTAENAMKWSRLRPAPGEWRWDDADAIVDFATEHGLEIKGHTLVWGQAGGNGVPDWLAEMTDPTQFRAATLDGITTEVDRYKGRVDRWDVVNEPLAILSGDLDNNVFLQRIGPDYLDLAFRTAHEADPDAKLWLNETAVEYQPAKADALVELVKGLKERGVPIDGVGIQGHMTVPLPLPGGTIENLLRRLHDLGVDTALTEVDVPVGPSRDEAAQAETYRQLLSECLAAACIEMTTWGVDDAKTWLDNPRQREANPLLATFALPSTPLLLDPSFRPKPAYDAVAAVLRQP